MAFQPVQQKYTGSIREVTLGAGDKAVVIGGRSAFPFYTFEGQMPHPPRIAMEVWDKDPNDEWSEVAKEPFKDVLGDPVAWAKKCVQEYGAEILAVQTKSADPNADNKPAEEVAAVVKKIVDAVDVPVVVWGVANHEKDSQVMRLLAEQCAGKNLAMAPVEEGDYKQIAAACLGYKHTVVASTPIDVNLAKQLNILLGNLGVKEEKIVMDPTTGSLGYGLEYTYSVMERITQAALTQGDEKLLQPLICNVGEEVWKTKEANQTNDEAPQLGDQKTRAVMMETITAVDLLLAGADVVILRHPESVALVKGFIQKMS
ncbi:acetyl-CoA decarbonylase/synthase complex subunit delta [Desulfosoma caldarium]|uniref:Acetyl-CoA decarbonylase/synthase delta subunit n=1 Tax=Desulfosoma caldarium TaxID=610254 RepID=A0A3N1VMT4_9BACT|nr:acetyl-CoA decarbonylase/synthase complex subunit delta [Desulfosoma caldarium]ROR03369.1 acetyl-CoA decarbonylase/synthase delta subunit [Desulfosoma caldarium]